MTDEAQTAAPAATSAPAAGETSPPAAEPSQATPPATTAEPPKPAPQTTADDGEGGEDEGKPSRSQRRKLGMQRLAAENEELRRQVASVARPTQDAPQARPSDAAEAKPPQETDFKGDYFAFMDAMQQWRAEQAAVKAVETHTTKQREQRERTEAIESFHEDLAAYEEGKKALIARIPDFDATIKTASAIEMSKEAIREILASDKAALIQYHLAKNPDKARELNELSGRELARAVGRLEGAVRLPPTKAATTATPPVTPLTGGTGSTFDPNKAEMEEFAAHWNQRETAKREARFK